MASGIVAKKIALFEPKIPSLEQQCRLKRKHAIRRKKYRGKERRIVTHEGITMIALSTSDEHLNQLKDSANDIRTQPYSSQFSASCSALFDLVSVESSESGVTVDDQTHMEIIPRSKRLILKSGSIENFSKRLNFIDIDIEIKIEKKEDRNCACPVTPLFGDQYEPLEVDKSSSIVKQPPVAVTDRIRLKASIEDSAIDKNVNYYCSNCSHQDVPSAQVAKNNNNKISSIKSNSSPEPLYENIFAYAPPPPVSLGAPPLPPKRLFGDTFTTNYSCLPAPPTKTETKTQVVYSSQAKNEDVSKTKGSVSTESHGKENKETNSDTDDDAIRKTKETVSSCASQQTSQNSLTDTNSVLTPQDTETTTICCDNKDNESLEDAQDEEPYYEDLYDYCNGSENGAEMINPLLELFHDQLHSLEQNVEDEVEYCDCSTILALMNTTPCPSQKQGLGQSHYGENEPFGLRSYEIYDDCFGVETTTHGGNEKQGNCDISNDDDIGLTKSSERNSIINKSHHILNEYIKGKAFTPSCDVTSSQTLAQASSSNGSKVSSSSNLLSMFPSLSTSKIKMAERRGAEEEEFGQNEASLPTVIAENERNVSKSKNADDFYAYNLLKSNNGNKPRFGGRPVIAHPVHVEGQLNNEDNGEYQNGEILGHKRNKKDDNEIFNKPLPLPPPNACAYESVYEEPIYGITNQLTATYSDSGRSDGTSPGKRRSSAPAAPFLPLPNKSLSSKPGSTYSHSPSVSSGSTYGYSSGSINEYGESSSASKYGPSSCQTVASASSAGVPPTADGMSIYGINDKLPPTPPNKFSSIAKTAGRKIAKKFLGIRRPSKTSLDDLPSSLSLPPNGLTEIFSNGNSNQGSKETNSSVTNSNGKFAVVGNVNGNGGQVKKPISRPSIPPPEPPKNEYGTNSSPTSERTNDYSIYDSNKHDATNDDDFDDSDFYDSDSELIRNFVSQVQPIYSMEEEPLYQYYTYGISLKPDDDYQPVIPKNLGLTLDMLVPRVGQRTLWCELPGVVSSGILSILSDKQKQLQEAIFEILTSEVSYLKSLDVLIALFYKNEELIGVLTEEERGNLFGKIEDVRDCSQAFLSELLAKWEESWYIQEIGDIIIRNTETRFSVYKEYCRNKPYQDKTMQKLRHSRDEFVSVVKAIEEDSRCQMLQIDSFLMLPMQRITRIPLLTNAVLQRTAAGKEKSKCEEALKCLTNLVLACNDAARESQDAEETMAILEKLEFTRGIKSLPDLGQFIMKGDFMKNPFDQGRGNQLNWTFRKSKRTFYWLLLFSKQLLVARRKANGRFEIIDMVDPLESNIKALPNLEGVSKDFKHFFMLHFNRKETVYFLAARTNSEVERWKSKLDNIKPKDELRVEAIFPYDARRPDEMSFYVGDVIRVSQMQPDGWYFGTKLATGESGWFPGNYCCENAA